MKFQAHITREQIPAVVAWGTTQRVTTFFSNGIDLKHPSWAKVDLDIRQDLQLQNTSPYFYSFEQTTEYQAWAIYHSVLDAQGNPGFYALGLFYPAHELPATPPFALLQSLAQLFEEKHVRDNRIVITQEAKAYFFNQEIKQQQHQFVANEVFPVPDRQKAVLYYTDANVLPSLFAQHQNQHFRLYHKVYLLPQSQEGLALKAPLPNINDQSRQQIFDLEVVVYDEKGSTQKPLLGVKFEVVKNNQPLLTTTLSSNDTFAFAKADQDHIRFIASKDGYKGFDSASTDQGLKVVFRSEGNQMYLGIPLKALPKPIETTPPSTTKPTNETNARQKVSKALKTSKKHKSSLLTIAKDKKSNRIRKQAITDKEPPNLRKYLLPVGIVLALVLVFIGVRVWLFGAVDWSKRTENLLQLSRVVSTDDWQWNPVDYQKFREMLVQQQKELAELQEAKRKVKHTIDLDSLQQKVGTQYAVALKKALQTQILDSSFNLSKSQALLKAAKSDSLETKQLELYLEVTSLVAAADQLIKEGNTGQTIEVAGVKHTPYKIYGAFNLITSNFIYNKYAFLSKTQRNVLRMYKNILAFYTANGKNNPKSLKQFRDYLKKFMNRTRTQEIENFLQKRGIA